MTHWTKVTLSLGGGLSLGALLGLGMSRAHPDQPLWVPALAYGLACGPILAIALYFFVLERRRTSAATESAQHSIEASWALRAGNAAWAGTVCVLIALSLFGQAAGIDWLEHLGTAHVGVVGIGCWLLSYALIRRREA